MSIEGDVTRARVPRDRGAAEAARFALLGLLLDNPTHGYDLARHFNRTSALGSIVHLSPSHLYALLGRMERDGLIEGEMQEAGNHPQRRVYRLTPRGWYAVERWMDEPVTHPRDMRIDFPVKLYIARRLRTGRAEELLARQRAVFNAYIERLQSEEDVGDTDDAPFIRLVRLGRIGRARAALEWLEHCDDLPPYTPSHAH